MKPSRRIFVLQSLMGAGAFAALAVSNVAQSQAPAAVVDTDPQATALGYKTDGTKADVKKYPGYTSAQSCAACVLFQGKATDTTGGCAVFGNKLVASKGWCSAWAKKPA